jgi:hypothetical protein
MPPRLRPETVASSFYLPVFVVLLEAVPDVPLVPCAPPEASVPPTVPVDGVLPVLPGAGVVVPAVLPVVDPDIEALPDMLPLGVDDEVELGELVSVEAVVVGAVVVLLLEPGVVVVDEVVVLLPVLVAGLPHPARPAVARAMAATAGRILFMVAP